MRKNSATDCHKLGWILIAAALLGFSGVAAGAFGAHALKASLAERGMLNAWEVAVDYQLLHAVALLAVAVSGRCGFTCAARMWTAGVVIFSGSLYIIALGGPKWLGPVTPIGGVLMMLGWLWLLVGARRCCGKRCSADDAPGDA